MLGEPKYRNGDKVSFEIDDRVWEGNVCIVDAYGTFEYLEDVSYDIMVDIGPKGELYLSIFRKVTLSRCCEFLGVYPTD